MSRSIAIGGAAAVAAALVLVLFPGSAHPDDKTAGGAHGAAGHGHIMLGTGELAFKAAPPSLPPGAELAHLNGDATKAEPFAFRLKMPAGYKVPPHFHPADEHVTVLEGTLHMGGGDAIDEGSAKELGVGGFAVMPKGFHHYAFTKTGATVQVHGMGPWGITYVNPADDPRPKGGEAPKK